MNKSLLLLLALVILMPCATFAQDDDTTPVENIEAVEPDKKVKNVPEYDPLAPARAAFYSAVLPGLGQAYNKQYWKIPIAYGGFATTIYFYVKNDREYDRFRDAFKRRLAGFEDDEFFGVVTDDGLIEAQRFYQRNKEISILVTVGVYILNIVDANVAAHLRQFNVNEDLSFEPEFEFNELTGKTNLGVSLNYRF